MNVGAQAKLQLLLALPSFPAASDFSSLLGFPPEFTSPVAVLPRTVGLCLTAASVLRWQSIHTRVGLYVFVPFTLHLCKD